VKVRVRQTWHVLFKREMFEQLLIKDLSREVIDYSKMIIFRTPFH
jgi:hypothetical protein